MSQSLLQLPIAPPQISPWLSCAIWSTRVLAGFIVLVSAILLGSVLREHRHGLLVNSHIQELQDKLSNDRNNTQLMEEIRTEDRKLREIYFARREFWNQGAGMLAIGGLGLAISIYATSKLGYRPYLPTGPMPKGPVLDSRMKTGIALATIGIVGFGVSASLPQSARLVYREKPTVQTVIAEQILPAASDEEVAKNWPMFRGHGGRGHLIGDANYPTKWNGAEKQNIAWTAELPLEGTSSPIVWENRVFVACGDKNTRQILCLDAETGKQLWFVATTGDFGEKVKMMDETTYAPSTPATDGQRVFALFPTGELLAADFAGKQLWKKQLGIPDNMYGHASSLLIYQGVLVVQYDQGVEPEENLSKAFAFDSATGKELWKIDRPVAASWSTPMAFETAGKTQLVMLGVPWTISYDLKTGAELWRAKGLSGDLAPSPSMAGDRVISAMSGKYLFVTKPDGKGDVTVTHQKKIDTEPLPDIVSPVGVGDRVFLLNGAGLTAWVDYANAKTLWEHDFEHGIHASPIVVGDKIYLIDNDGKGHVIQWGDEFKELAENQLEDEIRATPAFAGGKIYIRGKKTLYCIK